MKTQIINLDDENYEATLKGINHLVWLDFWGENCAPCQMIARWLERLPARFDGRVTVGKVNVYQCKDIVERYGVTGIPTFIFLSGAEEKHRQTNEISEAEVHELMDSLLAASNN